MDDAHGRILGELVSVGVVFGAVAQALPPISAALAICWYMVMLYDWYRRRRDRR